MMSSVFRRNSDIQFVIEDLKSIMDPNGGAWVDGKYMPSFIALLGRTLEQHLDFLSDGGQTTGLDEEINFDPQPTVGKPMQCTQCKGFNVHLSGGCPVCADCGHSKCG
jgi:ribonucleoside-diphosphate reductase alpha chain